MFRKAIFSFYNEICNKYLKIFKYLKIVLQLITQYISFCLKQNSFVTYNTYGKCIEIFVIPRY